MAPYIHQSLANREPDAFRILSLHPYNKSHVLVADLQIHSVSGLALHYETLSYCWGDAPPTCELQVNSHVLAISPTLHRALQRLRLPDEYRLIWVDAICIDQSNIDERNSQVGMMGDIYWNAEQVNVWLDDPIASPNGDACTSIQMNEAFRLIESAVKLDDYIVGTVKRHFRGGDVSALHDTCPNGIASLRHFFALPYWSRLWVIQELALGRKINIFDAENECNWRDLIRTQSMIDQYAEDFDDKDSGSIRAAIPLTVERLRARTPRPGTDLLLALDRFRSAKATDLRDKVFGLLGVVEENFTLLLKPDYSKSVEQVYHGCALAMLRAYQRLDFLSRCIYNPLSASSSKVPSWVPDWSENLPSGVKSLASLSLMYPFNASRPINTPANVLHNAETTQDVLRVEGIHIGIIRETLAFLPTRPEKFAWLPDIAKRHGLDSKRFQRILAIDRNPEGSYYKAAINRRHQVALFNPSDDGHHAAEVGRCFYSTDLGSCGLAYEFVRADDHVCVIFGCSVPIILRPAAETGHYSVLGEAFLDGYMSGEAVSALEQGELREETFYLQ